MFKKALLFGLAGAALIAIPTAVAHYALGFTLETYSTMEIIGYVSILLSMSMIFFSIRSRRTQLGGSITFGKAFAMGALTAALLAVLIGTFVVATFHLMYDAEQIKVFSDHYKEELLAQGKTPEEVAKEVATMEAVSSSALLQGLFFAFIVMLFGVGSSLVFALVLKRKKE